MSKCSLLIILLVGGSGGLLSACSTPASATPGDAVTSVTQSDPTASATTAVRVTVTTLPSLPIPLPTGTLTPTPSATLTSTVTPSPVPAATPSLTPTATPVTCLDRIPGDGLLTLVTRDFGLSRDYVPHDLSPLSDYFPNSVTLGYPTEVRAVIVGPLRQIIEAMQEDGLAPQIISGFRSYSAQSLALQKWLQMYPEWAHNLSAPPGHSEHQLGTTVDFGSPELKYMLDDETIQFHPAFAQTSEGKWLSSHASQYGFTMSYPADAFERTAFNYEPWHFRYVGPELATKLNADNLTISEYLEQEQPIPCRID